MPRTTFRRRSDLLTLCIFLILSPLLFQSAHAARDDSPSTPIPSVAEESLPVALQITANQLSGEIDYATALQYRAFARTGDQRLPEQFNAHPIGKDRGLWREIRLALPNLNPADREILGSYLLRPTDPASPLYGDTDLSQVAVVPTVTEIFGATCDGRWGYADSQRYPDKIKVWAHCDDRVGVDIARTLWLLESLWGPMVDLMGEPIPDLGTKAAGGTTALDVYLLGGSESIVRAGVTRPAPDSGYGSLGYAIEDAPFDGPSASGFIVMERSLLDHEDLRGTVAHEFFHILQYAHNYEIGIRQADSTDELGNQIWQLNWFFEASANWAHTYFVPETASSAIHGVSFAQCFQLLDLPLHYSRSTVETDPGKICHAYGAYIWLYFVEQELDDPAFMSGIWEDLESAKDWDDMMEAIDRQLPFSTSFRDFAVRNLNLDLTPGDAISPRYQDKDPDFPFAGPIFENRGKQTRITEADEESPKAFDLTLPALSARYYRFQVDDQVTQVTFDFTELPDADRISIDLLIDIVGEGWERRQIDERESITFCLNVPDDAVEAIYLVFSNAAYEEGNVESGRFTVSSSTESCR